MDQFSVIVDNQAVNALTSMAAEVALKAISKGFVIASIFYSPKAGEGSDLAQGRTLEQFLSLSVPAKTMGLTNKQALQQAANTSGQIAMPIRGKLVVTDDKINVMVVKTDEIRPVKVINAVQDAKTGLYIHSLPKNSHQTSTINVVTAPAKELLLTGQPPLIPKLPSVPVTVRNNPTSSQYAPIPLSVTTEFQDVILVYPEAAKMEPVYITYGSKTQSMVDQAAQQLDSANKSFAAIDKQYQAELLVLNSL
ncbi:MAG TPA: S-type pyocin domain-containing protein [Arsenophonus apicola]|uniref:S-type pyocin domain-containing protein n=1 Tax=Arsenophonus apicola TaxID=2879119 RepID=UPI001CDB9EF1|nr:S-type pyocin domain-containing protein [Arsenophonus apicola]UBX28226.1 S-type pyocin domain-containing protein [Arsenophonus apicola]